MATKAKVETTVKPAAVVEAEKQAQEKKAKLEATKADRDKQRAQKKQSKQEQKIEERKQRGKSFSWGNEETAEKLIPILEACLSDKVEISSIKNPVKMMIILATNMDGGAVTYSELADRANAWMHDSFAVSPRSQGLDRLSDERPIKAFNGRNEIWKMQKGMAPLNLIKGDTTPNKNAHSSEGDPRESLDKFNLIDEVYEVLKPELIGKLKAKFKR